MNTQLIILGSGTCVSSFYKPFDYLSPSAYLLQFNKKNYLLDCSEGVRARLNSIQFDYFNLDYIFITHFHPDHFNLDTLLQAIFVRVSYKPLKKLIKIYGPKGIKENLRIIWEIKHGNGLFEKLLETIDLEFFEYEDKKPIMIEKNVSMTPYLVNHVKTLVCYALRFNLNDKVFVYSGDSGMCEGIKEASKNADMFICECNTLIDGKIVPWHLRTDEVAQIASTSQVKTVILTHLRGKNSQSDLKEAVKKTGFQGQIIIATDLKKIDF